MHKDMETAKASRQLQLTPTAELLLLKVMEKNTKPHKNLTRKKNNLKPESLTQAYKNNRKYGRKLKIEK